MGGRWTAAFGLASLVACDLRFPDEFLVEDLRVLNVRTNPPEVSLFEPDGTLALDPSRPPNLALTPVELTALVAHPDLDAAIELTWIRCAPGMDRVPCAGEDRRRLVEAGGPEVEVSPVAVLLEDLAGRSLAEAVSILATDPRDLFNGLYAHVNLHARVTVADVEVDTPELEATKRVVIFDPKLVAFAIDQAQTGGGLPPIALPPGLELPRLCTGVSPGEREEIDEFLLTRRPNQEPRLLWLAVSRPDAADTGTVAVAAGQRVTVANGERLELQAVVPAEDAETYRVLDTSCALQEFEEQLGVSWFTTRGELSRQLTSSGSWTTTYRAPAEGAGPTRIWAVLRDGRGGSQHLSIEVDVVPRATE